MAALQIVAEAAAIAQHNSYLHGLAADLTLACKHLNTNKQVATRRQAAKEVSERQREAALQTRREAAQTSTPVNLTSYFPFDCGLSPCMGKMAAGR